MDVLRTGVVVRDVLDKGFDLVGGDGAVVQGAGSIRRDVADDFLDLMEFDPGNKIVIL